jgi:hypothetical protein
MMAGSIACRPPERLFAGNQPGGCSLARAAINSASSITTASRGFRLVGSSCFQGLVTSLRADQVDPLVFSPDGGLA